MTMPDPRTFPPRIQDRIIRAGGMKLADLSDDGFLIFEDRFQRRCVARGTDSVPVSLSELVDALIAHFEGLDTV